MADGKHLENPLRELIGNTVQTARIVHDYVHVVFDDCGLTINNDYELSGGENMDCLSGLMLKEASQSDDEVLLTFQDEVKLRVSLKPDAYHSPEAMVLRREGHPIVVWN